MPVVDVLAVGGWLNGVLIRPQLLSARNQSFIARMVPSWFRRDQFDPLLGAGVG
jgi:hypothetical protein